MSLAPLAGKDQIQLFAIASEPASSPSDPLTYRIIGPSEQEATQIVETISKQMQATTVAVLYVDTDYGRGLFQSFKQALTSATRLVYQDSFPASTEDLRPQLLRLKSKQPAAIFLIGWGRDTGLALKQAYELGIESQFICPQACQEKELIDVAGEAAEGLWVIASKEYAVAEISSAAMVLNEQTDNRNQFLQKKVINGEFVVQQKLG